MVKEKSGLEITVPDPGFTVTDVRDWVGPKRVVDIMDCATQKNSEMTMKEWDEYYYSENRTRKLNVISLEFSYTKMETLVQSPKVIRQIDWTDNIWPRHFKEMQTEVQFQNLYNAQCNSYLLPTTSIIRLLSVFCDFCKINEA